MTFVFGRRGYYLYRPHPLTGARETPAADWLRILRDAYTDDGSLRIMHDLVGDAAHALSNISGQGASLASESAVELARCVRDQAGPATAFAAYERIRRARVEPIAARAAKINRAKAPEPVARILMPALMPLVMKTVLAPERALGPVHRYTIDWDVPVTVGRRDLRTRAPGR